MNIVDNIIMNTRISILVLNYFKMEYLIHCYYYYYYFTNSITAFGQIHTNETTTVAFLPCTDLLIFKENTRSARII